jgi:Kdo2-lipid IVA lauroyltransferase/acyltransferase
MWLIHFLPLAVVAAIGNALGALLYWLIPERRRVTRINLAKCFPQMQEAERERLARASFRAFARSFLERGILWWAPTARVARLVRVEGVEHLKALSTNRVVLFGPHFVGLDAVVRLNIDFPMVSTYSRQKDAFLDAVIYRGRTRFGGEVFPRQAGLRPALRAIKAGAMYYYLPDMDLRPKRQLFVPFFGVPAATVTGLSYIARLTGAAVVPCVTRMLPGGGGYVVRLYPAWNDFPSGDDAADARRMVAFIEERVREMPEQYLWMHKRFKSRPQGEAEFY